MLKFRPSNLTQKRVNINLNDELQLIALIEKGLSDNSLRGFLYKRSSPNAKWRMKWFLLFENLLFYFDINNANEQQNQSQQQQQSPSSSSISKQQHQSIAKDSKGSNKASSALSSLIRRQNKDSTAIKQQQQQQQKEYQQNIDCWQQLEQFGLLNKQQRVSLVQWPTKQQQQPSDYQDSSSFRPKKPRRASAGGVSGCVLNEEKQQDNSNGNNNDINRSCSSRHSSCTTNEQRQRSSGYYSSASATKTNSNSSPTTETSTQRLKSDPASGGCLSTGDLSTFSGYDSSSAFTNTGSPIKSKRSQNSSSISGVSGHFLAHNEQTIGRSTTTTAGKTPATGGSSSSTSNYSSLLNRKIGVLFLEGSYCERLVDSGGNFTGHVNSIPIGQTGAPTSSSSSSSAAAAAAAVAITGSRVNLAHGRNSGSSGGNFEMAHHQHQYNETFAGGCSGGSNKSSNSLTNSLCNINNNNGLQHSVPEDSELNCIFTLKWRKEGSKEYQFRSETEAECQTWVHAISNARYSTLLNDKEQLEQKYLHLSQIIESESTAKWQYSKQCEEFLVEIKKLRQEICLLKRQESRSNHLKVVLGKSAAIIETIMRQQTRRQKQQQAGPEVAQQPTGAATTSTSAAAAAASTSLPAAAATSPLLSYSKSKERVRSMDQEQEEHEVAVRRTRRCNTSNMLRLASLDPQNHPLSGGSRFGGRQMDSQQHSSRSLARSATRPALPVGSLRQQEQQKRASVSPLAPLDCGLRTSGPAQQQPSSSSSETNSSNNNAAAEPKQLGPSETTSPPAATETTTNHTNDHDHESQVEHEEEEVDDDPQALTIKLKTMVEALNNGILLSDCLLEVENSEEIRKIKKVQGFFRGWLCRRRWKQIVQEYIKSPHAESMRKRNNLVFRMVECEEEYVEQLTLLISAFLRPIKMTASSQRPALNHDELNSIFLNSETLLFLHQIFLKGLTARMESWPTLILGDLFNMLLPMLTIYQEYVRNHHYSLQVLAECKQRDQFSLILRRLEEKPQLNGRTLETFLTYPMHQIPRYIICLHEILAHTPHNHVERKGLYEAQTKLEDLSRQMHDEVSETENIRQNLAIERMIIGGCDILLDVNQVFVRQGILLQVVEQTGKSGKSRSKLTSFATRNHSNKQNQLQQQQQCQQQQFQQQTDFNAQFAQIINSGNLLQQQQSYVTTSSSSSCDNQTTKDLIRQCFLFTNHLLLCTRTKDGKLHLLENFGRISLSEVTLIENPLEFVQQQETIIANFDSIPTTNNQQKLLEASSTQLDPAKDATSCSEHHHHQAGTDGATGVDKRTNSLVNQTVINNKSPHHPQGLSRKGNEKRNSHVEFDLDYRVGGSVCSIPASAGGGGGGVQLSPTAFSTSSRAGGGFQNPEAAFGRAAHQYPLSSVPCCLNESGGTTLDSATSSPSKQSTSNSSRRRLAGYLATKLSNLTNLGSGNATASAAMAAAGQQQLQLTSSSSAPPSPLNKRGGGTTSCGGGGGGSNQSSQVLYNNTSSGNNNNNNNSSNNSRRVNSGSIVSGLLKNSISNSNQQFNSQNPFYLLQAHYKDYGGCDFILIIEPNSSGSCSNSTQTNGTNSSSNQPIFIHLVAPNLQEKAAWMSDISQCIDNVHFNDLFHGSVNDSSSVTINQSVRTDPRLYKDDVDIKFSRALNSCKLPQIRYASKERLFERLTDLRFLSIDFLNTFLLTYRVFTTAEDVLEALKSVHYNCERYYQQQQQQHQQQQQQHQQNQQNHQQQLIQDSARDSFSVFQNSSLNSLNTNTNTLISSDQGMLSEEQQQQQHLNDRKSPQVLSSRSPQHQQALISNNDNKSPSKLFKLTQTQSDLQQQKPSIPPRSCGSSELSISSSSSIAGNKQQSSALDQQHPKNKFLLPIATNQTQKRRSTISALTPITGSNSSSLANLTTTYKQSIENAATSPSNQTVLIAPENSSNPASAASSLGRTSEFGGQSCGSNNLDDLLRLSEDESDLLISAPLDDDQSIISGRLRSASMTHHHDHHETHRPANLRMVADNSRINLNVPTCRQVRASSLSHVIDNRLMSSNGSKQQSTISGGSEHWRLSYKKATERSAGGNTVKMFLLNPGPAPARRASSSDVTFQVTLDPPPPVAPQNIDMDLSPFKTNDSGTPSPLPVDNKLNILPSSPIVPPSTPIEPISPMPETNDELLARGSSQKSKSNLVVQQHKRRRRRSHDRSKVAKSERKHKLHLSSGSNSSLVASGESSSSSSSLSYLDTKSVTSSQSESELIHSTSTSTNHGSDSDSDSSSQMEDDNEEKQLRAASAKSKQKLPNGAITTHHETKHSNGGKKSVGSDEKLKVVSKKLFRRQLTKQEQRMAQKLIIKEIELPEAKVFDCDTSADEDKVSTSSGSGSETDDQDDLLDGKIEDDDDRSFLILTRLNSVRLDEKSNQDDDDDDDDDDDHHQHEVSSDGSDYADAVLVQEKAEHGKEVKTSNGIIDNPKVPPVSKPEQSSSSNEGITLKSANKPPESLIMAQGQGIPIKNKSQENVKDGSSQEQLKVAGKEKTCSSSTLIGSSEKTGKELFNQRDQSDSTSRGIQTPMAQTPDLSIPGTISQRSIASVVGLNSIASPSSRLTTPRSSFQQQQHAADNSCSGISKAGVIVSSSTPRVSSRRSSTASAASAFAAATAASNNPILTQPPPFMLKQPNQRLMGGMNNNNDYNNLVDCLCSNFHRASMSSCQSNQHSSNPRSSIIQPRPSDLSTTTGHRQQQQQQQQQLLHYPSCIYYQQQQQMAAGSPSNTPCHSYPNPHSDASSICNSRASSRLSSCAGLEYSSYSSAPVGTNLYSQQTQYNQNMSRNPSRISGGVGGHLNSVGSISNNNEQSIANQMIQAGRVQNNPRSSKRNSTQINVRSVATIRVLSVLRHWVSKHSQDFVNDTKLSYLVQEFIQDLIMDNNLLPAEHKAALQLQQMVQKAAHSRGAQVDLDLLLAAPARPSPDSIETLSALEIAEGMTYLDHKIFIAIRSEEFLGQAWMKMDKAMKAPHILLITKRFNDVSRLVSSEIIRVPELHRRVAIIEKWTNVAHICRVVHNFNGVLQICAAFTNSAVFRLKKTWDKIPKTTKTTIDQLQNLVSTDSRFRNMRDAINRCDPPSIPYVGMYLTDLSFIEEGTPNYSPDGLLNFSKMRMIAHVIREIQHLQNGSYKIELNHRVANYLLDASRHLQDDEMYRCSLAIEPRSSGGKNGVQILNSVSGQYNGNNQSTNQATNQQQQQPSQSAASTPVKSPNPSKN